MMEFKITFDAGQMNALVAALLSSGGLSALNAGIAANARNEWLKLAGEELHSSRRDYVAGIQAVQIDGMRALIALVGAFPNMIEQGTLGFDLRETLLRQFGLHHRVIPFRHRTPGSGGATGVGTPMGAAYAPVLGDSAAKDLGRQIYKRAQKLAPGQKLPAGLAPLLKSTHVTDLYSGMQRMRTGNGRGQTRYMTFRTISEDSPPQSWMYPALAPRNLAEKVVDALPGIAEKIVNDLISGIGSGGTP